MSFQATLAMEPPAKDVEKFPFSQVPIDGQQLWHEGIIREMLRPDCLWIENSMHATDVVFSLDENYFALVGSKAISIYDVKNLQKFHTILDTPYCYTAAFSPDGHYFVYGSNETLVVLSIDGWKKVAEFNYDGLIRKVAFSPNSSKLAVGAEKIFEVQVSDWSLIATHEHQLGVISSITYISQNEFQVTGFNPSDKSELGSFRPGKKKFTKLVPNVLRDAQLSSDAKKLAVGGHDQKVTFFNMGSKSEEKSIDYYGPVNSIAFSPDNQHCTYGGKGAIVNCKTRDWAETNRISRDSLDAGAQWSDIAYSAHGNYLGAITFDTAHLIDALMLQLNNEQKNALKRDVLRNYVFMKTVMNRKRDTFYLNADGYETWQKLADVLKDDFKLYRAKANAKESDSKNLRWKIARKKSEPNRGILARIFR